MANDEGYRRHARIREDVPVRWRVAGNALEGEGVIRNLSTSGALLESRAITTPKRQTEFLLEAVDPREASFIPQRAKFVWGRTAVSEKKYYFCGLEFVEPSRDILREIEQRVEDRLQRMGEGTNMAVLDNYFGLRD